MTYNIQLNQTGTHCMDISEDTFRTIRRYSLFNQLVGSNGYVDETVLEKLKYNIRSLIAAKSDCKDLLDLCIDVIYHDKMKAYGLNRLIEAYKQWETTQTPENDGNID